MISIKVENYKLEAVIHEDAAPESVSAVRELLPISSELMHVRWSGIATWIKLDKVDLTDIPRENHTVYPSRGDILLYPGYRNEPEILISCGPTCFKSPAGELAGNHFASIKEHEKLESIEETTIQDGAQPIVIEER